MPKMTTKERESVMALIREEEKTLLQRAKEMADSQWAMAEVELAETLGRQDDLTRAQHLRDQIEAMQKELVELEHGHPWRTVGPSDSDYVSAGLEPPQRDRWGAVYEYGSSVPEVFGRKLLTKWDLEIFKILDRKMNILQVSRMLHQTAASVRREITLSGTFEEARAGYQKFYQILRHAGGKEIPPLLSQIAGMPLLLPGAGETGEGKGD